MNEAMIFTVGLTLGIVLSMLLKPSPTITIANSQSLDPYDDEDTDLVDDDEEGEALAAERRRTGEGR